MCLPNDSIKTKYRKIAELIPRERDSSGTTRRACAARDGANSPTRAQKNSRSRKTARLFFCSEAARPNY
jgi:hypothetical protein